MMLCISDNNYTTTPLIRKSQFGKREIIKEFRKTITTKRECNMKKWIECNKKASIQKSVISKECFKERVKHEKGATEIECKLKRVQHEKIIV